MAACLMDGMPVRAATTPSPSAGPSSSPLSLPPSLLPISPASEASAPESAPAATPGGAGAALGMQAAVGRAVRWHPLLRNARGQLLQVTEGIDAARAGYYPSVTTGVNTQASNQPIGSSDSHRQHRAEIRVSQMVYDFGKVGSQVDQATAASGAARAQVLLTFDQVIRNTAEAWIEVSRNEALAKVAEEQVDAVKALARLATEREVKGAGTYSDTAQAQARVDAAQVALLTARSQVRLWRTTLMHWVGTATLPEIAGAPVPVLSDACKKATASTLAHGNAMAPMQSAAAVQVAEAQLAVARAGLDLADAQLRPTLSVSGSVGRRLNIGVNSADAHGVDASVMLNFSMPLYQGGQLRSGKRAAGYGVTAARAALDQARLNANQGLQNAVLQWRKFSGRIEVQQAREENMRITRVLYRQQYLQLGTRSLLDLLNAEQEYYGSLNDQIESEHEMYRQGVECLYYMGDLRSVFGANQVVTHAVSAPGEPGASAAGGIR